MHNELEVYLNIIVCLIAYYEAEYDAHFTRKHPGLHSQDKQLTFAGN